MAASQGDDGVGSPDGPEHAGLFESETDYGLAAGLDHARTDKEVLTAKLRVTHANCVPLKVVSLDTNLLDHFGIGGDDGTERQYQLFDFPLVDIRRWWIFIQTFWFTESLG